MLVRVFAAGLALAVAAGSARAQTATQDAASELAALWHDACLQAFPDPARLSALAMADRFVAMTPDEAGRYLAGSDGQGWFSRTALANYAVVIQAPGHDGHGECSVRRLTPDGMSTAAPYFAARDAWIAGRPGALQALTPQHARLPHGAESEAVGSELVTPDGHVSDVFLAVVTEYHGRYRGPDAAATHGGPGVEVRLVHVLG